MRSTAFLSIFIALSSTAAIAQGAVWLKIAELKPSHAVNLAGFVDEKRGITAGYAGATYYSEDGGGTWIKAENASMCRFGLEILDGGAAITCGNGGNNRTSSDGGKTWVPMENRGPSEPDNFRFLSFSSVKEGWAAGPFMLSSTSDGGAAWSDIKLPEGIERITAIALLPGGQGKTGFLLGSKGELYSTLDGGATWSKKPIAVKEGQIAYFNKSNDAPSAALRFANHEEGIAVAYMTGPKARWVALNTRDAGDTWSVEEITADIGPKSSAYLSQDGLCATLYYSHRILVFKRSAGF